MVTPAAFLFACVGCSTKKRSLNFYPGQIGWKMKGRNERRGLMNCLSTLDNILFSFFPLSFSLSHNSYVTFSLCQEKLAGQKERERSKSWGLLFALSFFFPPHQFIKSHARIRGKVVSWTILVLSNRYIIDVWENVHFLSTKKKSKWKYVFLRHSCL